MTTFVPSKTIPLHGYTLSNDDIRRIFERLLPVINDQAEIEVAALVRPADADEEEWAANVARERASAFRCTVTINGTDGSSLFGDTAEMFSSANKPENVRTVYMTNRTAYRGVTGRDPSNSFEIFLDFSKPPLVDPNRLASAPTGNESHLVAQGTRDAWIAAVEAAVMGVLKDRRNGRQWMHKGFIYDYFLFFFILPVMFIVAWRVSPLITRHLSSAGEFVISAIYVYIFFLIALAFRIMFGYTRWAFPVTEYVHPESSTVNHRRFWYAILCSIVAAVLYDIFA